MVHGIYIKSRPKAKWHLVSVAISAELAVNDLNDALDAAKLDGNDQVEGTIQVFDSSFYIPEYLSTVKEQKLMIN